MKNYNRIPELIEQLYKLETYQAQIGILGEDGGDENSILMIAHVHEFGVDIRVTDRMINYLHSIGIHIRDDTDFIQIPQRSYLRSGFDENLDNIQSTAEKLLKAVIDGKLDAYTFYLTLGEQIRDWLQEYLTNLSSPPLTDKTIKRKGSSNPLMDTGRLRDAIVAEVVEA